MSKRLGLTTAAIASLIALSACEPGVKEESTLLASAGAVTSADCSSFDQYNSLADCQTATSANCSSAWQTYPNGGAGLCYAPVMGFEACSVSPPNWDWIYTSFSPWCDTGASSPSVYRHDRSLISCSSAVCICAAQPSLSETCSASGTPCPTFTTAPSPCP